MIINLLNKKYRAWWVLFHIILGAAASVSNIYVIGWFYFTLLGTIYLISFPVVNRPLIIASTMIYIGGFELLGRMTKCYPIIPWEASKYVFTILSIIGLLLTGYPSRFKYIGIAIIILLIPAIFIDKSGIVAINDIIFNVLGVINVGLGLLFFSSLYIKKERFTDLIRLMIFPCISIVVFTIIKTPDLQEISFLLGAQTSTSGEFGSNQVATVLGLGFLLTSMAWLMNWKITSTKTFDGLLSLIFLIQGLFTFSRGGMIGGAIAFILFLYFLLFKSGNKLVIPVFIKKYSIPILVIFIATIMYANNLTGGKLFLRYQGETEGTLLGTRDKDINSMTSNRNIIFLSDLELWWENPFLGAGVGTSKYLRNEARGTAAHIELSRLLAEHGLPGLVVFMLILYTGYTYLKEKDPIIKAFKISFFILAIFTTFHSATRTFITPLLLSLCAINVRSPKISNDTLSGK